MHHTLPRLFGSCGAAPILCYWTVITRKSKCRKFFPSFFLVFSPGAGRTDGERVGKMEKQWKYARNWKIWFNFKCRGRNMHFPACFWVWSFSSHKTHPIPQCFRLKLFGRKIYVQIAWTGPKNLGVAWMRRGLWSRNQENSILTWLFLYRSWTTTIQYPALANKSCITPWYIMLVQGMVRGNLDLPLISSVEQVTAPPTRTSPGLYRRN